MLSSSALRRHPASLLPRIVHNPSLTDLIRVPRDPRYGGLHRETGNECDPMQL